MQQAKSGKGHIVGRVLLQRLLERGVKFIESAQFMSHLVNIGDTRTLISHPASTTHRQLDEAQQLAAGVKPDMIRISVGLEHVEDILWDIDQALHAASR
mgnify:CR=1 FL=1